MPENINGIVTETNETLTATVEDVNATLTGIVVESEDPIHCFVFDQGGGPPPVDPPVVTIGAMPFARTVTATGLIVVSGTATNTPTSITWSASPSGASGSFTPAANWSGTVSISPTNAGEGVETITVTATNDGGSDTDTVTVGFYVTGAHSIFHAQNIDGQYNATLVNNDSIDRWQNLGSSAYDVIQPTLAARPTYKTNTVGGQPVAGFDGADNLYDEILTAANWNFINNSVTCTTESVYRTLTDTNSFQTCWHTFLQASGGAYHGTDWRTTNNRQWILSAFNISGTPSSGTAQAGKFQLNQAAKNTANANDQVAYLDGSLHLTSATTTNFNSSAFFRLGGGASISPLAPLTGEIWRVMIYSTELSLVELQINEAVDEWALGATFPVTP